MSVDQEETKARIDFLTREIKHNRSQRYSDQQKYTPKECDELEAELRKIDPDNPLFYKLKTKSEKIKEWIKVLSIVIIAFILLAGFIWYFYIFFYDPIVYNPPGGV
ncbi:MAG: hypothetical protein ACXABO_08120 [Promethearchaeota archaeon]|jgi:hypothetical protein